MLQTLIFCASIIKDLKATKANCIGRSADAVKTRRSEKLSRLFCCCGKGGNSL